MNVKDRLICAKALVSSAQESHVTDGNDRMALENVRMAIEVLAEVEEYLFEKSGMDGLDG